MSFETLTAAADRIIAGTVEKVEPRRWSRQSSYIVTDVTVRSDREVLGVAVGERFIVRHLGGELDGIGQRVHGEASYRVGETVVVFAARRPDAYYAVGMAQGALHLPDVPALDKTVARLRALVRKVETSCAP
jgi:GMP synthase-like glutamine amidotransferase